MKLYQRLAFFISSLAVISSVAIAQVDPATSLLLKSSGAEASTPNLDSSRYTIRSGAAPRNVKSENETPAAADLKEKIKSKISESKKVALPAPVVAPPPAGVPAPAATNDDIAMAIKDVFLGGDEDTILKYKEGLHPQDPRQNLVNISVAPTFSYIDASSKYWFKKFHSAGPGLFVGAEIWYTPFAGVALDYATTLASDINVSPTTNETALVDHRYTNAGFQFRKYATLSRRSPSLNFGLKYTEYQMIVPKAEASRIRLKMTGVAASVQANLPKSNTAAWFFATEFIPKLKVSELSTALNLKTGTDETSYAIKFALGQEFTVDRSNRIYWRLSHRVDKSIYEGLANQNDPVTGAAPTGVTVTTGTSLFEIGYTWGN